MRSSFSPGFTLIEMLVVIGIIAALIGASLGSYSFATKHAQAARGRELVSNVATALNVLFQRQNRWPPVLREEAEGEGRLTAKAAYALAKYVQKGEKDEDPRNQPPENRPCGGMGLSYDIASMELTGLDRCGIVDPWAMEVLKRLSPGDSGLSASVPSGGTVKDHILYYALDLDGDGITEATVGGVTVKIRGNAAVWSCGLDGALSPYPYAGGGASGSAGGNKGSASKRGDDIYSWAPKQVVK